MNLSLQLSNVILSATQLSNDMSRLAYRSMHYGKGISGDNSTLSGILQSTYGADAFISAGYMDRVTVLSIDVLDANGEEVHLYLNDYVIFKNDISDISKAALSDFDIVRDAQAEAV